MLHKGFSVTNPTGRYANIEVTPSIDFYDSSVTDLTKNKEFWGGSLSVSPPGNEDIDAPVYNIREDAYSNTRTTNGFAISEWQWDVPESDTLVSLGTVTYNNQLIDNDERLPQPLGFPAPRSAVNASGSKLSITIDAPIEAELETNLYFDYYNQYEDPEELRIGFRGADPNSLQFKATDGGGNLPIFFDLVGYKVAGSDQVTPISETITVADDSSVNLELVGRVYTVSEPIFRGAVNVTRYTDEELREIGHTPGATTNGEKAYVYAELDPNFDLTTDQAAELSGYDHFNWYQKITSDTQGRNEAIYGDDAVYPWTDPNPYSPLASDGTDSHPYYWDEFQTRPTSTYYNSADFNLDGDFSFRDRPTVDRTGVSSFGEVSFETHLVGVDRENSYKSESLYNFNWSSSFNSALPILPLNPFDYGEVTIGDEEYTLLSPQTDFYAPDVLNGENGEYGFVEPAETSNSDRVRVSKEEDDTLASEGLDPLIGITTLVDNPNKTIEEDSLFTSVNSDLQTEELTWSNDFFFVQDPDSFIGGKDAGINNNDTFSSQVITEGESFIFEQEVTDF